MLHSFRIRFAGAIKPVGKYQQFLVPRGSFSGCRTILDLDLKCCLMENVAMIVPLLLFFVVYLNAVFRQSTT